VSVVVIGRPLSTRDVGKFEGPQILSNLRATSDAGPVSRILCTALPPLTVIPLGRPLLTGSSDLPGSLAHRAGTHEMFPSHSSPIWSCSVWGLPCPGHYCPGGALLPHLFTLTATEAAAVYSLWHFPSNGLEPTVPDVIRHTALRSSDFPLSTPRSPSKPWRSRQDSDHPVQHQLSLIIRCIAARMGPSNFPAWFAGKSPLSRAMTHVPGAKVQEPKVNDT